jgi:hypothetical protein
MTDTAYLGTFDYCFFNGRTFIFSRTYPISYRFTVVSIMFVIVPAICECFGSECALRTTFTITTARHTHGFRATTDQRCQDQERPQVRCSYPSNADYQGKEGHSTRFCAQTWGNTFRYPSASSHRLLQPPSYGPWRNKRPVRSLSECVESLC